MAGLDPRAVAALTAINAAIAADQRRREAFRSPFAVGVVEDPAARAAGVPSDFAMTLPQFHGYGGQAPLAVELAAGYGQRLDPAGPYQSDDPRWAALRADTNRMAAAKEQADAAHDAAFVEGMKNEPTTAAESRAAINKRRTDAGLKPLPEQSDSEIIRLKNKDNARKKADAIEAGAAAAKASIDRAANLERSRAITQRRSSAAALIRKVQSGELTPAAAQVLFASEVGANPYGGRTGPAYEDPAMWAVNPAGAAGMYAGANTAKEIEAKAKQAEAAIKLQAEQLAIERARQEADAKLKTSQAGYYDAAAGKGGNGVASAIDPVLGLPPADQVNVWRSQLSKMPDPFNGMPKGLAYLPQAGRDMLRTIMDDPSMLKGYYGSGKQRFAQAAGKHLYDSGIASAEESRQIAEQFWEERMGTKPSTIATTAPVMPTGPNFTLGTLPQGGLGLVVPGSGAPLFDFKAFGESLGIKPPGPPDFSDPKVREAWVAAGGRLPTEVVGGGQ